MKAEEEEEEGEGGEEQEDNDEILFCTARHQSNSSHLCVHTHYSLLGGLRSWWLVSKRKRKKERHEYE